MALVGFMAAGKTAVGRALAARLGWPHVDTDDVLGARFGPVGDQVRADVASFRAREAALAAELSDGILRVVSTGGGWVEAPGALERLLETHVVVFLDAPLATLARRAGGDRPLWDGAVAERWARRRPSWDRAHVRVDADAPLSVVVDRVARALVPADLVVGGPAGPCPVAVLPSLGALGPWLAALAPGRRVLVTDRTVAAAWGPAVAAQVTPTSIHALPPGEANKTLATWAGLVDDWIGAGVTRDTTVVAVGGGVVGDVAGFAAAATLRGLPIVQVPTTLLAMVDSALGGKTGVDHPLGKNLVGAFHPPIGLAAWPGFLSTLPPRERASGGAEVLKTALVGDADLWDALGRGPVPDDERVRRCLAVKARRVEVDPSDRGPRLHLNAGHTVGHAIEQVVGFGAWTHGEAVGVGLVAEAEFAVRAGVCAEPGLPEALRHRLRAEGLPVRLPERSLDALVAAAALDKKGRGDTIQVPLPVRVGEMTVVELPRTDLRALFVGASE